MFHTRQKILCGKESNVHPNAPLALKKDLWYAAAILRNSILLIHCRRFKLVAQWIGCFVQQRHSRFPQLLQEPLQFTSAEHLRETGGVGEKKSKEYSIRWNNYIVLKKSCRVKLSLMYITFCVDKHYQKQILFNRGSTYMFRVSLLGPVEIAWLVTDYISSTWNVLYMTRVQCEMAGHTLIIY